MKTKNVSLNIKTTLLICAVACFLSACAPFGGAKQNVKKLFVVKKDGKYGFMDNQGKIVIQPTFDGASDFSEGLAQVVKYDAVAGVVPMDKTNSGYIDETGKFVIEPKVHSGVSKDRRFSEGVAVFPSEWFTPEGEVSTEAKKSIAIDKTGKTLFELDENKKPIGAFADGLLLVQVKEPQENWRGTKGTKFKYGYVDKTGKFAIEPKEMISANPFSEGLALITIFKTNSGGYGGDALCGFIDTSGKTVIEPRYKEAGDFHEGLARVSEPDSSDKYSDGDRFGFIDRDENWVGGKGYEAVSDFHDGLAIIPGYVKYQIRDKTEKTHIFVEGAILTNFSEGLSVLLDKEKKMQIISSDGKTIAPVDLSVKADENTRVDEDGFQGGLVRIAAGDETFYVDKGGKIVWRGEKF